MKSFKLRLESLEVDTFDIQPAPIGPGDGLFYIEPAYTARNTCPEGNCAPYTQGGEWQATCNACTFSCHC